MKAQIRRRSFSAFGTMFFILLQLSFFANAQTENIVPANNPNDTTERFPITAWYDFNRTQLLYKNSELGFSNKRITDLGFYVQSRGNGLKACSITVRIKTTSDTVVLSSSFAQIVEGSVQVFTGTVSPDSIFAGKWINIKLQTPFDYSGSNNLVVIIESNKTSAGNDQDDFSKRFRCNKTNIGRFQKWWSDNGAPNGQGTVANSRPNIRFLTDIIPGPCSGTPNAGIASVSANSFPCPGQQVQLSLSGYSGDNFISLQWQRQVPSVSTLWQNIPEATLQNLTTIVTTPTNYRCKVTCTPSSLSANSTEVSVNVSSPTLQIPFSQGFGSLVSTEGQQFPLGCGFLRENISGTRGWRGTLGRNGDPNLKGIVGRTDSAAIYSGYGTIDFFYLPAINMSADSSYALSFYYKHSKPGDNNEGPSFDVRVGNLPESGAQTTVLGNRDNQNDTSFQQMNVVFRPLVSGLYNFSIRNKTIASNPYYLVVDDILISKSLFVGINEIKEPNPISIYPNPNKGNFKIVLSKSIQNGFVEVLGLNGKCVLKQNIEPTGEIKISGLKSGIYLLKLIGSQQVFNQRLVVE